MGSDVPVVGARLAGLAAAAFLAERGKRILIIDEMPGAGGRLLGQRRHVGGRADGLHDRGWWISRAIAETGRTDRP